MTVSLKELSVVTNEMTSTALPSRDVQSDKNTAGIHPGFAIADRATEVIREMPLISPWSRLFAERTGSAIRRRFGVAQPFVDRSGDLKARIFPVETLQEY